jgi:hypothetical protein
VTHGEAAVVVERESKAEDEKKYKKANDMDETDW